MHIYSDSGALWEIFLEGLDASRDDLYGTSKWFFSC